MRLEFSPQMTSNRGIVRTLLPVTLFLIATFNSSITIAGDRVKIRSIDRDFPIAELGNKQWGQGEPVNVRTYWSGKSAKPDEHFAAVLLWSSTGLYVRFAAVQSGPVVISDRPNLESKTMNLWERDVCEIFIAPDRSRPRKYVEFEIAPNGEWIDLAIDFTGSERKTDWNYRSNMESAARIEKDRVVMAMKIPWTAFGVTPKVGDFWLGNLFRCVGRDPDRRYLAWRPTMTEQPNFHVPDAFGELEFAR